MNPFKKGDVVEVVESRDTVIINDGEVYTVVEDHEYWVRIECPTIADGYIGGWEPMRFKLVEEAKQEPPKPPSFKNFLSPMCRVEMRGYGIVMFDGTYFVAKSSIACRAASYTSGDGRYKKDDSEFRCFDILRVYKSPDHGYGYPLLEDKGELLWESPEIVTKRKEKDEKIAFKQIEINMAQRKLDELVKQLKEIE